MLSSVTERSPARFRSRGVFSFVPTCLLWTWTWVRWQRTRVRIVFCVAPGSNKAQSLLACLLDNERKERHSRSGSKLRMQCEQDQVVFQSLYYSVVRRRCVPKQTGQVLVQDLQANTSHGLGLAQSYYNILISQGALKLDHRRTGKKNHETIPLDRNRAGDLSVTNYIYSRT
jgi:hypothetical protein